MRDYDIRLVLRQHLKSLFANDPTTLIIDELGLCEGAARVDIAVVNGALHGYEIKSERDTLARLPRQSEVYCQCFDMMTAVVSERHVEGVLAAIPEWWGISKAIASGEAVRLVPLRDAKVNNNVCAAAIVQLLWRDEAFAVLRELNMAKGLRCGRRRVLWEILSKAVTLNDLRTHVREKIKARQGWRSGGSQVQGNDLSPISAMTQDSQENLRWLLSVGSHCPPH